MGISIKGYRKVKYKKRLYIWKMTEVDVDLPPQGFVKPGKERYLNIIGSKKQFIVRYRMPRPGDEYALLKIEGPKFPRRPGATQVRVPRWRHDGKRYPTADFVRRLIGWCHQKPASSK